MRFLIVHLFRATLLLYPFLVFFGMNRLGPRAMAMGLLLLFAGRLLFTDKKTSAKKSVLLFSMAAGLVCFAVLLTGTQSYFRWTPVFTNFILLCVFFFSYLFPPSVAEQFARIRHTNLPQEAVPYTEKVTLAWCVFFALNAVLSAWTALYATWKTWTLYNGLISYILVGLFFTVEFWIRKKRMRAWNFQEKPEDS